MNYESISKRLVEHGQEHLLRYYDELTDEQRFELFHPDMLLFSVE